MFGDLGYSTGIFYCKTWGSVAAHLRARDGQDLADVDIERAFKDQYCTADGMSSRKCSKNSPEDAKYGTDDVSKPYLSR